MQSCDPPHLLVISSTEFDPKIWFTLRGLCYKIGSYRPGRENYLAIESTQSLHPQHRQERLPSRRPDPMTTRRN